MGVTIIILIKLRSTMKEKIDKEIDLISKLIIGFKKKTKGLARLKKRLIKISVRKSPCGNGTSSFDTYEIRLLSRVLKFESNEELLRKLSSHTISDSVEADVILRIIQLKRINVIF